MRNLENGHSGRRLRAAILAATAIGLAAAATGAHATQVGIGTPNLGSGILPTFSTDPGVVGDPNNPGSPDLNAVSATGVFDAQNLYLTATMAGAIGLTHERSDDGAQGVYVWGVDRGKGTAILNTPGNALGTDASVPIGGPNITFDAFIVMQNLFGGHGDGFVALIGDDGKVDTAPITLDATNISFAGDTISLVVPLVDLPSTGRTIDQYGLNIWPRYNSLSANTFVASFLPGDHDFKASAAPEPAAWALMIAGFGLAGGALRARRRMERRGVMA